jgi:hypothetical protein
MNIESCHISICCLIVVTWIWTFSICIVYLRPITSQLKKKAKIIFIIIFFFNVHGSVHCNNILIRIYIQQDATLHSLFYLKTALHISGGTTTHHQEGIQLYLQHLVFVTPLLLSAAIAPILPQDATLHSLFYLKTALHILGGTTTHHQERRQLYLQRLVFVTPLLLSSAIIPTLPR